ncbi:MAG: site-2 protease family protein [Firmicutes bacterium]|nr:site-2 protease family protein [Bacillota bacterium]
MEYRNNNEAQEESIHHQNYDIESMENNDKPKPKKKGILSKIGIIGALFTVLKFGKLASLAKILLTALKASKFMGTFITMGLTILIYSQFYGWLFALGFVIAIFIHEMGHFLTSKVIGLKVSAPMFIPFLGAFIGLKEQPKSIKEESITAIGGPAAGLLATIVCLILFEVTNSPYWAGLTYISAFLNLFNLLPFGPLDGGRITKALSPLIWVIGLIGTVILIWKLHAYILIFILIVGIIEVFNMIKNKEDTKKYLEVEPQFRVTIGISYILLVAFLSGLMMYSLNISQTFIDNLR